MSAPRDAAGPADVPAVLAQGLGYAYPDGRRALSGVSFSAAPGETVGVIGPNGAGKTTLLQVLAGIFPRSEGRLEVFGIDPDGKDRAKAIELRRRVGLVFQSAEEQLFSPTVFDDVAFGPLHFGVPKGEIRERVARALRAAGLEGFEERSPHHLSAGERRRVAIASVLSYDPDLLILDEPTSDLDPRGRRELVALLAGVRQARIVASHDLEFIARTCRRAIILCGGSIRADLPAPRALTDRALLESSGLEIPLGLAGLGPEGLERLIAEG